MQETVTPQKKLRSDGLVLVIAVLAALAGSYLSGLGAALLPQAGIWIRLAVFLLLTAGVYWIVRKRMTSYRYVAGDNAFAVYRTVGRREARTERIAWEDAMFLRPYAQLSGDQGREFMQSACKKNESMALAHRRDGVVNWLIISPGNEMREAIIARIPDGENGRSSE